MAQTLASLLSQLEKLEVRKENVVFPRVLEAMLTYLQKNPKPFLEDVPKTEKEDPQNIVQYFNKELEGSILYTEETAATGYFVYKHQVREFYDRIVELLTDGTVLESKVQKFYPDKQKEFTDFFEDVVKYYQDEGEEEVKEETTTDSPSEQPVTAKDVATAGAFAGAKKGGDSDSSSDGGDSQTDDQPAKQEEEQRPLDKQPSQIANTLRLNRYDRAYVVAAAQYALLQQLGIENDPKLLQELGPELELINSMLSDQLNRLDLNKYELNEQGRLTVVAKTRLMSDLVLRVHADGAFEPLNVRLLQVVPQLVEDQKERDEILEKVGTVSAQQVAATAFPEDEAAAAATDQEIQNRYAHKTDLEFKRQMAEFAAVNELTGNIENITDQILKDVSDNKIRNLSSFEIEQYLVGVDKDFFNRLSPGQKLIISGKIYDAVKQKHVPKVLAAETIPSDSVEDRINAHLNKAGVDPNSVEGIRAKKRLMAASLSGQTIEDLDVITGYTLKNTTGDADKFAQLQKEYELQAKLLSADYREETIALLTSLENLHAQANPVFMYPQVSYLEDVSIADRVAQESERLEALSQQLNYDATTPYWYNDVRDQMIQDAYANGFDDSYTAPQSSGAPLMSRSLNLAQQNIGRAGKHLVANRAKKKVADEAVKKAGGGLLKTVGVPAAIGGGAFVGVGSLLNALGAAGNVALVGGLGSAVGGVAGFILGGPVGAAIGVVVGGGVGTGAGIVINGGSFSAIQGLEISAGASEASKAISTATNTATNYAGKVGYDATTAFNSSLPGAQGFGGGTGGLTALSLGATAGSLGIVAAASTMTMASILSTFTPDANTSFTGSFSTDVFESRYLTVRKVPNPKKADDPQAIEYTIEIRKKDEGIGQTIVITDVLDEMSVVKKDDSEVAPPELPADFVTQLSELENKTLADDEVIRLNFSVNTVDAIFDDAVVRNDLKVAFTVNGTEEEANVRAQTCFGDCPISEIPPCWPAEGLITQPPYSAGGGRPTRYCIDNPSHSHCGGYSPDYKPDAYDVANRNGGPIFAALPGRVDFVETKPIGDLGPLGYYVRLDHGSFQTIYSHFVTRSPLEVGEQVAGGQVVGMMGTTGNSTGIHLHYEVKGLDDYVLIKTFGVNTGGVEYTDITCDQFYGNL